VQFDAKNLDPEVLESARQFPSILQEITRENLAEVRASMHGDTPPDSSDLSVTRCEFKGRSTDVTVFVYRPKDLQADGPCLLWIHGGGYIMGQADGPLARSYAEQCACTVVSVEYRMAPEYPFPAGPEDCHDALLWLHENATELGIDPKRISIGGVSAGAGMAAGVTLMNRDLNGPALSFQYLLYPMLDNLHDTPSGYRDGQVLWNRKTSHNAWEMYLDGQPGVDASPYAAAARATDLSGLPPAYVCVGDQDLFRDECIDYARRLMLDEVPTELGVFPGVYHGAESFAPAAKVSQRMHKSMLAALTHGLYR